MVKLVDNWRDDDSERYTPLFMVTFGMFVAEVYEYTRLAQGRSSQPHVLISIPPGETKRLSMP